MSTIFLLFIFLAYSLASFVKVDVVIKIPLLAPGVSSAPENFYISGLPTTISFHLFACMYMLSSPNLSSFIIPSIPPSQFFLVALPASSLEPP